VAKVPEGKLCRQLGGPSERAGFYDGKLVNASLVGNFPFLARLGAEGETLRAVELVVGLHHVEVEGDGEVEVRLPAREEPADHRGLVNLERFGKRDEIPG